MCTVLLCKQTVFTIFSNVWFLKRSQVRKWKRTWLVVLRVAKVVAGCTSGGRIVNKLRIEIRKQNPPARDLPTQQCTTSPVEKKNLSKQFWTKKLPAFQRLKLGCFRFQLLEDRAGARIIFSANRLINQKCVFFLLFRRTCKNFQKIIKMNFY